MNAPRPAGAAIPAAPQNTLLEWIELDDGNTTDPPQPPCSKQAQAIHARIMLDPHSHQNETAEPLQAPTGLRLPPLG
jgi:hypothetical protein